MEKDMNNSKNIIFSLLIGTLAGAAAMLLFAPQSGKKTLTQIQHKGGELLDKTNDFVKDSMKQIQVKTNEISKEIKEKAGQAKEYGQDKLVKGLGQVSDAIDGGKDAIKDM